MGTRTSLFRLVAVGESDTESASGGTARPAAMSANVPGERHRPGG
jgi:hypothetical protein